MITDGRVLECGPENTRAPPPAEEEVVRLIATRAAVLRNFPVCGAAYVNKGDDRTRLEMDDSPALERPWDRPALSPLFDFLSEPTISASATTPKHKNVIPRAITGSVLLVWLSFLMPASQARGFIVIRRKKRKSHAKNSPRTHDASSSGAADNSQRETCYSLPTRDNP